MFLVLLSLFSPVELTNRRGPRPPLRLRMLAKKKNAQAISRQIINLVPSSSTSTSKNNRERPYLKKKWAIMSIKSISQNHPTAKTNS
eukprot:scaffold2726_cov167-Amphora_coffeaeformis.AAC.17